MKAFDLRIHTLTRQKEIEYTKDSRGRKIGIEKQSMNIETSLTQQSVNSQKSGSGTKYSFKIITKKQKQSEHP